MLTRGGLQKPIHATASYQKILHLLTRVNLPYFHILKISHPLKSTGNRVNVPFILTLQSFEFCLHCAFVCYT